MIDSGASKNYIRPIEGLDIQAVNSSFNVNSIHGSSSVVSKCFLSIFRINSPFFILPQLSTFDGIIGLDTLNEAKGIIDLGRGELITQFCGPEKLKFLKCKEVNYSFPDGDSVPSEIRSKFRKLLQDLNSVFADPNEALPFNTNIIATIRTRDNEAIYSKSYPYPMGVGNFVNSEVCKLLDDGIIRPSRSPYNNPIWVVDKKGHDSDGNRNKRLVIDFRKLNDKTIDDKYPIPDISVILSNLGKAKFFTTLDLKSGFHQIQLAERDREKTAFSINNGKYEFCRLPFGLKNAPSIFQRAIDDVLRENIGKFLHVYIDDIIVFSSTAGDHLRHLEWVLKRLIDANMAVSIEKSIFFRESVEYLGFVVGRNGITTCKSKVEAIASFPEPQNLFELRSFLGLAGYYRRFVKGFASIAKPLTDILRGDNGKVSAVKSKNLAICLSVEQRESFHMLRQILSSEDVILLYPDFTKPLELTTDASMTGLGAVLSQNGKPITMISRTLKGVELDYATNERELLAIVWALKKLRNFLYGSKNLIIFTDHQPLTFSVSDKNTNAKIQRWKAFIEEHNAKIVYKPGKENIVADALSRQSINIIDDVDNMSTSATVHSEESLTNTIRRTDTPLNCYKNQIVIEESDVDFTRTSILFRSKKRHFIQYNNINHVLDRVKDVVDFSSVNAINCSLNVLATIQDNLIESFPSTKFWFAPNFVLDITNLDEQREIVIQEHSRAHRCAQNVVSSLLRDYYFPKMGKMASEVVSNCKICLESKYQRHPSHQNLGVTPTPKRPGERLHIDIFSTDGKYFLTCIDKFSKFVVVQNILSRNISTVAPAILQIVNFFPEVKYIYCDNEGSFNSNTIAELLNRYGIQLSSCPPFHSSSNGQVERFHSTLIEIARCLKEERSIVSTVELILAAAIEYNKTIHTVTKEKPIDILFSSDAALLSTIEFRLAETQSHQLEYFNKNRVNRGFDVGQIVYVKKNKRIGNKLATRFVQRKIEADLGTTVLIRGKEVHKDNVR